jgi:hypothetical protein
MSMLIPITDASRFNQTGSGLHERVKRAGFRTAYYRRMLSEMRMRPPSQRLFLKRLSKRAAITGAALEFPVTTHVSLNPVDHT